ncbi:MAG: DUF308 domain-containing protein [Odoribacteraceae bacterium]|jgi:uncharacterized membrane protein HdeD (DUF308 family)|nr:DUF308 domain-containing protein [Odoribacteraceae bacterium]
MRFIYSSSFKSSFTGAAIAIALGIALVTWPSSALNYLVQVIGATFCVVGTVTLLLSTRARPAGLLPASGVVSIVFGLVLLFMPGVFTGILIYLLGFMLLFAGAVQFSFLLSSRKFSRVPAFSYFLPVVTLAVGVLVIANPFETREAIVILFGITSIFWGVSHLINHYAINKAREANDPGEANIVDTDYEEV